MGLVAKVSCRLCAFLGIAPLDGTEVHHKRSGTGGGRKACDFETMALCFPHHRSHPGSFHELGTKGFVKTYGITEDELIAMTRKELNISDEQIEQFRADLKKKKLKSSQKASESLLKLKDVDALLVKRNEKSEKPKAKFNSATKIESRGFSQESSAIPKSSVKIKNAGFAKNTETQKIVSKGFESLPDKLTPKIKSQGFSKPQDTSKIKKSGFGAASAKIVNQGFLKSEEKTKMQSRGFQKTSIKQEIQNRGFAKGA